MRKEFLIVGRGIAGAVLSLRMIERSISHDIIDAPQLSASSKVAAGVINPVVLKRLKIVAGAAAFMEHALPFYADWEARSGMELWHSKPIAHIFQSIGELNAWHEKQDNVAYSPFLGSVASNTNPAIVAPLGQGLMKQTGWLDTNVFLDMHKQQLPPKVTLTSVEADLTNPLSFKENYMNLVVCTGHLMKDYLKNAGEVFSPTRGEIIIIETDELSQDYIVHGPVFILPLGSNRFKVGATYHWDKLEDTPTPEGLDKLQKDLEKIFKGNYKIIDHQAGVRPNTRDRKPLLGKIEEQVFCFNGLGSRGALMAPLLANQLLDYMMDGHPLSKEFDIERFLG